MTKHSIFILLFFIAIFNSCIKKPDGKNLEIIEKFQNLSVIHSQEHSLITNDGTLVVFDKSYKVKFYDIENGNSISQPTYTFAIPNISSNFYPCMRYYDDKLWIKGQDTIYVFPTKPSSNQKALRKILFLNTIKINEFAVGENLIIASGMKYPQSIYKLFKSDISKLWNPIYDNQVYKSQPKFYENTEPTIMYPKYIKNGCLFSKTNSGFTMTISSIDNLSIKTFLELQSSVTITDDFLITSGFEEISTYDISNPLSPKLIDLNLFRGGIYCVSNDYNKLYTCTQRAIRVFDISDKSKIKFEKLYEFEVNSSDNDPISIEVKDNIAYIFSGYETDEIKLYVGRMN